MSRCERFGSVEPGQALVNRAAARCASGDYAGAQRDCATALRVAPKHPAALRRGSKPIQWVTVRSFVLACLRNSELARAMAEESLDFVDAQVATGQGRIKGATKGCSRSSIASEMFENVNSTCHCI